MMMMIPDVIRASPPCTSYSIAAVSHHRNGQEPKTEFAKKSDLMIAKVHEIIDYFMEKNPDLVYYIENPRGMLRKMDFMRRHPIRHTVTYCQYGDTRMKPTDIWTNDMRWILDRCARTVTRAMGMHPWIAETGNTGTSQQPRA